MPEKQSQFYSAAKWTWLIILLSVFYSKYTPTYHFTQRGNVTFRGNTLSGRYERLEDNEWVSVTESDLAREWRLDRKKKRADEDKRIKNMLAETDDDDESLDFIDRGEDLLLDYSGYKGRGT